MKNYILAAVFILLFTSASFAQQKIKDGSVTSSNLPNANAVLEVESNHRGLLFPRVPLANTTSATPLATHVAGMVVYNTSTTGDVTPGLYYNDGTKWIRLADVSAFTNTYWGLAGNTGTNSSSNFLGTLDNTSLHLRTNNTERMVLDSLGNVTIGASGTINTVTKLQVNAGNDGTVNSGVTGMHVYQNGASTTGANTTVAGYGALLALHAKETTYFYQLAYINETNNGKIANYQQVSNILEFDHYTLADVFQGANFLLPYGGYAFGPIYSPAAGIWAFNGSNTKLGLGKVNGTNAVSTNTAELVADLTAHAVGIGTSSPAARLDVNNNASSTQAALKIRTPFSGATADSILTWNPADSSVRKVSSSAFAYGAGAWTITGNAGISSVNFLGTTNNASLRLRTNNTERMVLDSLGNVAIGVSGAISPVNKLQVNAGNDAAASSGVNGVHVYQNGASTTVASTTVAGYGALLTLHTKDANYFYNTAYINDAFGKIANYEGNSNILEYDHFTVGDVFQGANFLLPYGGYAFGPLGSPGAGVWAVNGSNTKLGLGKVNGIIGVSTNTAELVVDITNHAIGIGTSSPAARLDVNNNASSTQAALKIRTPFTGATTDSILTWNPADSSVRKIASSLVTGGSMQVLTGTLVDRGSSVAAGFVSIPGWSNIAVAAGHTYKFEINGNYQTVASLGHAQFGVITAAGATGTTNGFFRMDNDNNTLGNGNVNETIIFSTSALGGIGSAGAFILQSGASMKGGFPVYLGGNLVFTCVTSGTISFQFGNADATANCQFGGGTLLVTQVN